MPIQLSGSLVITGSITTTGVILMSGSIASASYSSTSDLLQGTGSVGFATTASLLAVSSSQQQISSSLLTLTASYAALSSSYTALSGSYNTFSGSASTRTTQIEQVYATTGSNSFRANQSITGSLVVSSTITAQTLVVQTVTSSIVYSSGSNLFGSQLANTQTFTGSIQASGSSSHFLMGGSVGIGITNPTRPLQINAAADTRIVITDSNVSTTAGLYIRQFGSASAIVNNSNGTFQLATNDTYFLTANASGQVGIGTTQPSYTLDVAGTGRFTSQLIASSTSGGTAAIFQNTGAQNSNGIELRGGTGGTAVNWKIEKDNTVSNAFQLTPSTTNGGSTYTTPVLTIASTGAATFSSTITSAGDVTITKASDASFIANNTSASGKSYRLVSKDDGKFYIQNTGIADLFNIASSGAATFASSVTATTLALGSVTPSTNGIYLNNATANGANYGYVRTNALTVNTTQLILGSTYGYNTPVDALTIFNGSTTFANSITAPSLYGNSYAQTSTSGTTSFVNTGIFYNTSITGFGNNSIYNLVISGNPNGAGSSEYRSVYLGYITITTGYDFGITNVVQRINYTQVVTGDAYNIGALTISVVFWDGTTETTQQINGTTNNQIRVKITGYNSGNIGAAQTVLITKVN